MPDIPPPTQVLMLVFGAWASGTAIGGAVSRLDGAVQAGHFKVIWIVAAGLFAAAGFAYTPAWIFTALSLATFAAIYRGLDLAAGIAVAVGAVPLLGGIAIDGAGGDVWLFGYTVVTAALLGAVTNAMLLGHWHLNQPRLGTAPIQRLVYGLWGGLAAFTAASGVLVGVGSGIVSLGAGTAIAFAVFSMVLTAMVTHLVRIRSIMSATGVLYLTVLLCLVAAFTGSLGALARVP